MDDKLVSGYIQNILTKCTDPLIKKITGLAKDEWEKFKIDFDLAFIQYLKNAYDKYSKVKTVLYKTEPKALYDFFECPTVKKEDNARLENVNVESIWTVSNCLILQGTGGIGKSTLMKYLFLQAISSKLFIPIFIELKDLNDMKNDEYEICDFIFSKLNNLGSSLDKGYLEYALKSGCFLLFLDGYDEILTEKRNIFFKKFDSFCDKYPENYYIISSRPYSEFVEFQRFTILRICDFSKEQALSLINKIDYDHDTKIRFLDALETRLYDSHRSFASNPLLLNIMLLTYDNYSDIPQKLHLFYEYAFETLYSKHDATKGGYKREIKSKLSYDLFKKVFSQFCFSTYFNGKIEFEQSDLISILEKTTIKDETFVPRDFIEDLINSVCVLYKDGLNYKFTHRSFQEYFAAIFLKDLSDGNMKKMGIKLINKDTYRAIHDNVFRMLYDMSPNRTEQNIFLPLLKQIDNECTTPNKYDFYFEKFEPVVRIGYEQKRGFIHLAVDSGEEIMQFFRQFVTNYYDWKNYDFRAESQNFVDFMIGQRNHKKRVRFSMIEYKEDYDVYSLFKKTWVGYQINVLSQMRSIIEKKQLDEDLNLDELLLG